MKQRVSPSNWYISVSDPASFLRLLVAHNGNHVCAHRIHALLEDQAEKGDGDYRNIKGNEQLHSLPSILVFFAHDSKTESGWLSLVHKPTGLNTLGKKVMYYFAKQ